MEVKYNGTFIMLRFLAVSAAHNVRRVGFYRGGFSFTSCYRWQNGTAYLLRVPALYAAQEKTPAPRRAIM
jgi:hypothetical protein